MLFSIDIWEVLAGVAIFMLGGNFMDEALRSLTGRRFKLYLKKQTGHKLRAVTGGFLFSSVLQSSSIVNLLVLSLAGAGIIQLANALAIVLGSNLGSTATNWLIAALGFDFAVEQLAFPLAGITGIGIAFIATGSNFYYWCRMLFGFSLLFIGVGFIKSGMTEMIQNTDFAMLRNYPLIIFSLTGFFITALVQSSSATVALVLSSLYVHAISLPAAMAVVLGSEAGTTLKLFLASAKGNAIKKRIAYGNLLFNILPISLFLLLIHPSVTLISEIINVKNELYALVLFQTLVNLGVILLFFPFLDQFARWLSNRFIDKKTYTLEVNSNDHSGVDALEQDTYTFIRLVLRYCELAVHINDKKDSRDEIEKVFTKNQADNYLVLKSLHGQLHSYYSRSIREEFSPEEIERLEQLIGCIRNGLYAAKSIQNAVKDIEQLYNSSNDAKYNYYLQAREKVGDFCSRAISILNQTEEASSAIVKLYVDVQDGYDKSLKELYSTDLGQHLQEQEISTVINFNRETYTAFKSILFALKDYLLQGKAAKDFDNRPGFIH